MESKRNRDQAKELLWQDEERVRLVLDAINDGFWDWNIATGEVYYSPHWQTMLGYEPNELESHLSTWQNLLHPDDKPYALQVINEHIQRNTSSLFRIEFRLKMKSGGWKWILGRGKVVERDEQGKPLRMVGTHTDIDEQKQTEEALQRHAAIIELTPDAIATADINANNIMMNKAFRRIAGIGMNEDISTYTIADMHPPWALDIVSKEGIPAAIRDGVWQGETALWNIHTKEEVPVSQVILAHKRPDGSVEFLSTIMHDLTEIKQAEKEQAALQQQVIEAQQAALRELSAPLLPISDGVVVLPLVGSIDTQRAQQVMETLLEGTAHYRAKIAIVDMTGVSVVDTQVANALIQSAQAVRLLGAQVILTGIGPIMAQTLVHLGTDLSGIVTRGTLQAGIAYAMEHNGGRAG